MTELTVHATDLDNKSARREFIRVPWTIHGGDPMWRAPVRLERELHLSPRHNPAFEHLDMAAWIARRDGQAIGRITAQVDRLRARVHSDSVGYFGFIEAPDEPAVFEALLRTAEQWLAEHCVAAVQGPFNPTINDECGLLVEGFDSPPSMMMGHAQPYYGQRIAEYGYQSVKDMLAYWIDLAFAHPPAMQRLVERYRDRIAVRPIDRRNYASEFDLLRDIFNDAWANNWGAVPFTQAEFRDLGNTLRYLVADDLVQIAEVDGEPAAFIVGLPNLNEAARDIDGRLLPTGVFKLLWRLKVRFPKTARVPLMGVRQPFQGGMLGAALAYAVIAAMQTSLLAHGARGCELSWILENNSGMRDIIESLGGQPYKTYRIYQKTL